MAQARSSLTATLREDHEKKALRLALRETVTAHGASFAHVAAVSKPTLVTDDGKLAKAASNYASTASTRGLSLVRGQEP